jgi:predicted acetyltransferase
MRFVFLDPGPLVDNELSLIAPDHKWVDEVLAACAHPLTQRDAPHDASMTRGRLLEFLHNAPGGRQQADPATGRVPSYHFWMRLESPTGSPAIQIVGGMGVRIGTNREIELYSGNIGYHVYPPARGHHYAERACRLVLPFVRRHGMERIWITCNPDNRASRRTCERLGPRLIDTVPIPREHPFRSRGETAKCRYLIELP